MNEQWQYQLRVYLTDDLADVARSDRNNPALRPLTEILDKHHATLVNQFDAFASYVVEAEKEGPENFPLYKWTKAVVAKPRQAAEAHQHLCDACLWQRSLSEGGSGRARSRPTAPSRRQAGHADVQT